MHFNVGVEGEAKPHSSCVMTTVASILGRVEQTTGWWAIICWTKTMKQQPHTYLKKFMEALWPNTSLASFFKFILLCSLCPVILTYVLFASLCFSAWSSICPIYLTHCNISEQLTNATSYSIVAASSRECYCVSVFPHMAAKECLLKKPQRLSGAAWLLLPWSGAFLREAASFLYHLRLPGPQSCVSQLWREHFLCWLTERVKQPPVRGRRCMCVFNVLEESPGCLDRTGSCLTATLHRAN